MNTPFLFKHNYQLENQVPADKFFTALIVEDDLDICYLLSVILKKNKLLSRYVNSLAEAKKSLNKDIPDILILDNHLPDGLGIEFIAYIKANYPAIRIIMITAHDTLNDRNNALKEGADYFLGKPFTLNAINATLQSLLN